MTNATLTPALCRDLPRQLLALSVEDAIAAATELRRAAEAAECAMHARALLAQVPALRTLDAEGHDEMGDEGRSYLSWDYLTLGFADGRKLQIKDLGLCQMGELLVDEGDVPEVDFDTDDAHGAAFALFCGLPIEAVERWVATAWELVFLRDPWGEGATIDVPALAAAFGPTAAMG